MVGSADLLEPQPQRILATDLTTDPGLLTRRRENLAVNRQLLQASGTINRLFIAYERDLGVTRPATTARRPPSPLHHRFQRWSGNNGCGPEHRGVRGRSRM
ncbi:hypothetical protein [Streptomyces sp. NPDC048663]|uniref:hypothetical protein n=1 Tax=Streptomyces sp. NPDC048663 TaxID=3155638 RepID=UPI00343CA287